MRLELIGKSVNAPRFLETLEGKGWFVSYTLLLAEKHFEMPDAKKNLHRCRAHRKLSLGHPNHKI